MIEFMASGQPVLNELAQQFKAGGFDLVEEIWKAGALEEKLLAVKMLGKIAKKDPERSLQITNFLHGTLVTGLFVIRWACRD